MKKLKNKVIILTLLLVITILGTIIYSWGQKNVGEPLIEVSNQELVQLLNNKENFSLYIGRPTCPQCKELEPILKDLLKESDRKIYYYNIDDARAENEVEMKRLIKSLGVTVVPTIEYIENGHVADKIVGLQKEQEIKAFLQKYEVKE
ncbi:MULTISPECIES: thioredoxin family protein [Bacillus cereus group]|mgnify:CR=1 FL=1|uniref:Uncharacterized protein n=1 Tax=Bacillus wiedmannii TaxID=1890302 RepID=A0A242ZM18_9BACI|nr:MULTISPECIES: thioredoxin family protein [Bacillus cereus group]PDY89853.1 thioredoxin [Bacillus anthracis]MED2014651.1 thioredoxin family protein [Bacillus wiedmannii]MED3123365.1 thioredoxin family protein [Bacillus wiedmannii]OTX96373.1 hypothetical protein BK730_03175 [Bacillus wiedmannii]PEY17865.1 thioredoxin [Bacillus anthracis]